ncbi:hypothetical protein LCGC14_2577330 [marine sediment metagenome]|uniref:Uncharacterized protein n=1 Tax=marine sediment metagenome TaxID=412755 RepID=A0A0F9AFW0_9ZZZZ
MKKWIIHILILLIAVPLVTAICCERNQDCIIVETCQDAACGNCSITVYNKTGAVKIPQSVMNIENIYLYTYNASTSLDNYGTYPYAINCTNNKVCRGDCRVEIKTGCEGNFNIFYLYIVGAIIFFVLLGLGHYMEEPTFIIISGMLSMVLAINLFINGFPNLTNEFLKNGVVIVLAGIGMYLILIPSLRYLETFRGGEEEE